MSTLAWPPKRKPTIFETAFWLKQQTRKQEVENNERSCAKTVKRQNGERPKRKGRPSYYYDIRCFFVVVYTIMMFVYVYIMKCVCIIIISIIIIITTIAITITITITIINMIILTPR